MKGQNGSHQGKFLLAAALTWLVMDSGTEKDKAWPEEPVLRIEMGGLQPAAGTL